MKYIDILNNQPQSILDDINSLCANCSETENLKRIIVFVHDAKTSNEIRSYVTAHIHKGNMKAVKHIGMGDILRGSSIASASAIAYTLDNGSTFESMGFVAVTGLMLTLLIQKLLPDVRFLNIIENIIIYIRTRVLLLEQGLIQISGPLRRDCSIELPFFNESNIAVPASVLLMGTIEDHLTELFNFGFGVGPIGSRYYKEYVGIVIRMRGDYSVFHMCAIDDRLGCTINRNNKYHQEFLNLKVLRCENFTLYYQDGIDSNKLMYLRKVFDELCANYSDCVVECTPGGMLLIAVSGGLIGHEPKSTVNSLPDDMALCQNGFFNIARKVIKIVMQKRRIV